MDNNGKQDTPASAPTHFWHPFSNMAAVAGKELVIERGQGVWVWDEQGKRYLDATASLWYCFVGHGRAELAEAAAQQIKKLAAYSTFGDFANRPALDLAERIASFSPMKDTAVFFTSGGSESIETAAKMARHYWTVVGKPDKHLLVTRGGSYHGMGGYGTSLAGIQSNAAGYGELVPGVIRVAPDDPQAFAKVIEENPGRVAAFFGEPVRGSGGVYPPTPGYWNEIQKLCRQHDVLLVADEVVTGFGRLGRWFGSQRFDIQPDLITGAKGVTSGYLPLGVVLCGARIQEPFWRGNAGLFRHGYTYSGHAAACAVGLANLDIIEKEKLIEKSAASEPVLAKELKRLQGHPLVQDVRSIGLTAAIELSESHRAKEPALADRIIAEGRRHGILTRSLLGQALQVSPPLVISHDEIRQLVDGFAAALDAVAENIGQQTRV